jgi:hypothetical protein
MTNQTVTDLAPVVSPGLGDVLAVRQVGDTRDKQESVAQLLSLAGLAAFPQFQFFADQFENPVNADWAVNALAPASPDSNNAGLTVRLFDDTVETGVGFSIFVPDGATNIILLPVFRAEVAPPAARTIGLNLYTRLIPDNAVVAAWSAGFQVPDVAVSTNEFFNYFTQTVSFADAGLVADTLTQFELTRIAPIAGTDLVDDWDLIELGVKFSA